MSIQLAKAVFQIEGIRPHVLPGLQKDPEDPVFPQERFYSCKKRGAGAPALAVPVHAQLVDDVLRPGKPVFDEPQGQGREPFPVKEPQRQGIALARQVVDLGVQLGLVAPVVKPGFMDKHIPEKFGDDSPVRGGQYSQFHQFLALNRDRDGLAFRERSAISPLIRRK